MAGSSGGATAGSAGGAMAGPSGGRKRLSLRSVKPIQLAVLVLGVYVAFVGAYLAAGHDVRDFIRIGTVQVTQGHGRSSEIRLDRGYRPPANQDKSQAGQGYDGQYAYFIAVDPARARYYLDVPSYRYSRILYPLFARVLALGNREAVPWTLLLINLLAIVGGTWGLAIWLLRRGSSPWWALIYGLWPGMFVALQRDLTEPLAYGLVVAGLLALDGHDRWRLPAAGVMFGLAGLTRQTTLVFPIVLCIWLVTVGRPNDWPALARARRWRTAIALLCLSLGPYVAYWIFLRLWLGNVSTGGNLTAVPFAGIVQGPYRLSRQGVDAVFILLPVLVAVGSLLPRNGDSRQAGAGPSGQRWLPWCLLTANVLINLVFHGNAQIDSYTGVSRETTGVVISVLLCLPYAAKLPLSRRKAMLVAAALAMVMLPVVVAYGFTNVTA